MAGFAKITATNARSTAAARTFVAAGNGKTQSRPLPSVIGSVAPAHGFTHAVSPTACHFPPSTPDRSHEKIKNPARDDQKDIFNPVASISHNHPRLCNCADLECSPRNDPTALPKPYPALSLIKHVLWLSTDALGSATAVFPICVGDQQQKLWLHEAGEQFPCLAMCRVAYRLW